jgi:hypothetical protein
LSWQRDVGCGRDSVNRLNKLGMVILLKFPWFHVKWKLCSAWAGSLDLLIDMLGVSKGTWSALLKVAYTFEVRRSHYEGRAPGATHWSLQTNEGWSLGDLIGLFEGCVNPSMHRNFGRRRGCLIDAGGDAGI